MDDGDTRYRSREVGRTDADVERVGDAEGSVEPDAGSAPPTGRVDRLRSRLSRGAASVFSVRTFLLGTVLCLVGLLFAGPLLPAGGLGGLLGVALAGFGVGLLTPSTKYVELALAGLVAGGVGAVFDHLVLTLLGVGIPLVAAGAVTGGLASLVGHYFGNDLRDGLTRDLNP